jgi:hypothetical protein
MMILRELTKTVNERIWAMLAVNYDRNVGHAVKK